MYKNVESSGSECNILLVEDCPDSKEIFSHVLRKIGANITCASNGQECVDLALKAARENKAFDMILMDLQMPVMDGHSAARVLRESGYKLPILAMTARCDMRDEKESEKAGCNGHISKLAGMKGMLAEVKKHLTSVKAPQIEIPVLPLVPQFIRDNPGYAELAVTAIASLEEKMGLLRELVGKTDFAGIRDVAYQLGNLSLYGYSQFSILVNEIIFFAENQETAGLEQKLQSLERAAKAILAGVPKLKKLGEASH